MSTTTDNNNNNNKETEEIPNPYKRAKLDHLTKSDKIIGTHSGTFQADEAMGVWMLRQIPEYWQAKVIRSRDQTVLDPLDIVLDVGGVYDHSLKRYDHHQRGYDERFYDTMENDDDTTKNTSCTKLSASGLIYRHYGKDVIRTYYPNLSESDLDYAYHQLYKTLLEALDAIDTGVEMLPPGVTQIWRDTTGLSSRVSRYNPRWNEPTRQRTTLPDERFELASRLCGTDFLQVMTKIVESDIPARELVEKAIAERYRHDPSGRIVVFQNGGMPWKKHLYDSERQHVLVDNNHHNGKKEQPTTILFVLYTDQGGMWRVQAVTVEGKAFENRRSLPKAWRGVRDEDLVRISGIPGSRFVHAAGFIGGNDTYEGALQMARVALQQD